MTATGTRRRTCRQPLEVGLQASGIVQLVKEVIIFESLKGRTTRVKLVAADAADDAVHSIGANTQEHEQLLEFPLVRVKGGVMRASEQLLITRIDGPKVASQ
jgi:hypothetical protein